MKSYPNVVNGVRDAASVFGLQARASLKKGQKVCITVQRVGDILDVRVSDLMCDAPQNVVTDIVLSVISRMAGVDRPYSEETVEYLYSGMLSKRFGFLVRKCTLTTSPEGRHKDLRDSYDRLVSTGLIEPIPDLMMVWTIPELQIICGSSNSLRMIWVSGKLDSPDVPDRCLDAAVYTLLNNITRCAFTEDEAERYRRLSDAERRFPQYRELMTEAEYYINKSQ